LNLACGLVAGALSAGAAQPEEMRVASIAWRRSVSIRSSCASSAARAPGANSSSFRLGFEGATSSISTVTLPDGSRLETADLGAVLAAA